MYYIETISLSDVASRLQKSEKQEGTRCFGMCG